MTVLDNWLYGDPETVAIRRQEAQQRQAEAAKRRQDACGQCVHSVELMGRHVCDRRHTYGFRCRFYQQREENT